MSKFIEFNLPGGSVLLSEPHVPFDLLALDECPKRL
jgi:hypothetical protein